MKRHQIVKSLIKKGNYKHLVEVGVYKGALSAQMLSVAGVQSLLLVDPWNAEFVDFLHEGKPYRCTMGDKVPPSQSKLDSIYSDLVDTYIDNPKVKILRATSVEAARKVSAHSVDFVFIDAIHLYEDVKQDIELWTPKIREGGMIAGDDYLDRFPGVKRAVDELGYTATRDIWYHEVSHSR